MKLSIVVKIDSRGNENGDIGRKNSSESDYRFLVKEFRGPVKCEIRSAGQVEIDAAGLSAIERLRAKVEKWVQLPLFS